MQFLDFFCQGLGPFKSTFKVIFEGKSAALYGASGSGKTTIFNGILCALYDEHSAEIRYRFINSGSEFARVALTFRTREGIFRIIKDFTRDKIQLYKYAVEEKKFTLYTEDPEQVTLFLSGEIGIPDYRTFKQFFTLSAETLPDMFTSRPRTATSSVSFQLSNTAAESSGGEDRISVLKEELKKAEKIKSLEFEMDVLEQKLFDLEEKKRNAAELMERMEELAENIKRYEPLDHLPPDIEEKVKNYGKQQERLAVKIGNLDERLNQLETEKLVLESFVPWKDTTFFMGIALLIGGMVGFFLTPAVGWLKYVKYTLPLLSTGGLGTTIYTLWKFFGGSERLRKVKEEILRLQREKRKLENSFEMEFGIIPQLMQDFNLNFPEEILELKEKKKELEKELEELKAKTGGVTGEEGLARLDEEMEEVKGKIQQIKAELETLGPLIAPEEELRKELEALEGGGGRTQTEGLVVEEGGAYESSAGAFLFEDLFLNSFQRDFPSFVFENSEILGRFIKALTGGRWEGLGYTDTLTLERENTSIPVVSGSSSEKMAVALSLVVALRVWVKDRFPMPLMFDTPEAYLSSREKQLFARFLSEFARRFQLIVFYKDEDFPLNIEKKIKLTA